MVGTALSKCPEFDTKFCLNRSVVNVLHSAKSAFPALLYRTATK